MELGLSYFGTLKVAVCLLLVAVSSALPNRRLSDTVLHYEEVNYDLAASHRDHQTFSRQWKATANYGGSFYLTIDAFGRSFRMELRPDREVFADDAEFLTGTSARFEVDRTEFVVGKLVGDENSFVHGSIARGRFRGIIRADGQKYMVDPVRAHFQDKQPFHSVMYRDSDVLHEKIIGNHSHMGMAASDQFGAETSANIHEQVKDQIFEHAKSRQRRQATTLTRVECRMKFAADHTFSNHIRVIEALDKSDTSRIRAAVLQHFALFVREANEVYPKTKFLSDSKEAEGFRLAILSATVYQTVEEMRTFRKGTTLDDTAQSANSVLKEFSKQNWNDFCLSYLIIHRDFSGGVLGLAYTRGICNRNYGGTTQNTGLVTSINSGRTITSLTSIVVFIHEVGHNFGSGHDPASCQPSDSDGGKYVMFQKAANGLLPNNRKFSPCSRTAIGNRLKSFIYSSTTNNCLRPLSMGRLCGNEVKEGSEQCDCGLPKDCEAATPKCCNSTCGYTSGSVCSNQDGPCCSDSCQFVPPSANRTCSEAHECRVGLEQCDGTSAGCPRAISKPDGTLCSKKRFTCDRGDCNGSLCALANLVACPCPSPNECAVCCTSNGACTPLKDVKTFNATGLDLHLPPGFSCRNKAGYCNFLHFCREINDTGLIFKLTLSLFSLSTFQTAWKWAKDNWYYVLLSIVGVIVLFALVIHFGSKKTPRTVEVKRRNSRQNAGASGGGGNRQANSVEMRNRSAAPQVLKSPSYNPL